MFPFTYTNIPTINDSFITFNSVTITEDFGDFKKDEQYKDLFFNPIQGILLAWCGNVMKVARCKLENG